jgi:hypothetical protein
VPDCVATLSPPSLSILRKLTGAHASPSRMDPLSALSIAAAVVQFVEIGGKFFTKVWAAYRNPDANLEDVELAEFTKQLAALVSGLRESAKEFLGESPVSSANHELVRLCDECEDISSQFHQILDKIQRRRRGKKSVSQATQVVLAGIWGDGKIAKLKGRLADLRPKVMTAVLFCLWYVALLPVPWCAAKVRTGTMRRRRNTQKPISRHRLTR